MKSPKTQDSLQIARLEEQFSAMRHSLQEVADSLRAVRAELAIVKSDLEQAKGGWRVLMLMGGAAASLGAGVLWVIQHIQVK